MSRAHIRIDLPPLLILVAAFTIAPSASADTLWTNALPTTNLNSAAGSNRSNVAPVYGSLCDANTGNCDSGAGPITGATNPYILGDQFVLSGTTNTITQVTIYEVGNTPTSGAIDDPTDEFNSITLYIGADHTNLTNVSSSYSFQQVQYTGGLDYESINSTGTFFPIFAITFSGLNFSAGGPGVYDFAIGADPKANNTFALLASDSSLSGSEQDSSVFAPDNGFLFFFDEGSGPLSTYQYGPGFISNYNNGADANVIIEGIATPEPSTLATLGIGLLAAGFLQRRRLQNRPL